MGETSQGMASRFGEEAFEGPKPRRFEIAVAAVTFVLAALFVAYMGRDTGFFADDVTYYKAYLVGSLADMWTLFLNYVPGRNLHIVWQDIAYLLTVRDSVEFGSYHALQSLVLVGNAVLAYVWLRRLRVLWPVSLVLSLVLVFWPTYQDAVFWPSALPMHLFSGTLLLGLLHAAVSVWRSTRRTWSLILLGAFYLLATFTYDQAAAAAACILLLLVVALGMRARADSRPGEWPVVVVLSVLLTLTVALYSYLIIVVRTGFANDYGPTIRTGIVERILGNADFGLANLSLRDGLFVNEGFWGVPFTYAPLYALRIIVLTSLVLALISIWKWIVRRRTSDGSDESGRSLRAAWLLLVALALLGTSVAAYLPAWAWWVAPRHNYIPVLFIPLAFACIVQAGLLSSGRRLASLLVVSVVGTGIALGAVFAFELKQAAAVFTAQDQYRNASYDAVHETMMASGFASDACVQYVEFAISDNTTPFYTEITTWALDMHSRDPSADTRLCPAGTRIALDPDRKCAEAVDGSTLNRSTAYVYFSVGTDGTRDWTRPELVPPCDPSA